MRKGLKLLLGAALLLAAAVVALLLYLHAAQPPAAARLLPEGDFLLYANLKPLHLFDLGKGGPIQLEGDYQNFVAQTGIQFERDLDEVAMSRRDTADHRDVESSEIFIGRFDPERLKNYLQKTADKTEQYRDRTIYSITHEGHLVRLCLLDNKRVAVTNMASPEPMHGIIDRDFKPTPGPWLLAAHYHDVPMASVAWVITRTSNQPEEAITLPGGFTAGLPPDTVLVGSLRYGGSLLLRADVFAQSEAQAKEIVESASTHLALVRSIGASLGARGEDKDLKSAFDSIQIAQKENVAVFTATIPKSLIRKIWSEAQQEAR
jgi:hypothetical protein